MKLGSTVRYLGIEVDDALSISELDLSCGAPLTGRHIPSRNFRRVHYGET